MDGSHGEASFVESPAACAFLAVDHAVWAAYSEASSWVIHVVPDAISRLVATDTSIDGRRDRSNIESPHPNIWQDCMFIRESSLLQGLAEPLPTLSMDTNWVDYADTPRGDRHKGNRIDRPNAARRWL
jgi:hypothetical protein